MKDRVKRIFGGMFVMVVEIAIVLGLMYGSFQYGRHYEATKYQRAIDNFIGEIGNGIGIQNNIQDKWKFENVISKYIDR